MKKILNTSIIYFILAVIAGIFYREFTKYNGFMGETTLKYVHAHLFVLGMILFLIIALFCLNKPKIHDDKTFKRFFLLYNISLPFMACMLAVRGVIQVKEIIMTDSADAVISGMAGISHILITIAFIMLFIVFKRHFGENDN